jgi:hypothetical protein
MTKLRVAILDAVRKRIDWCLEDQRLPRSELARMNSQHAATMSDRLREHQLELQRAAELVKIMRQRLASSNRRAWLLEQEIERLNNELDANRKA